jgi:hypothetical protein
MATCRKLTLKEMIATREREAGVKLPKSAKIGLELLPPQYVCTGEGVGGLRGTTVAKRRQPRRRRSPRRRS